ncbi:caspase family protein [Streptomyces sp. NPDC014773]|uniref:effector-associated domain 2-containing protein n=1 Tax=Streptomyces sp. NPDC014773 TaxID=3364908 RepID=UPI003700E66C
MTGARPGRTHALVVGVERYAAGPAWDLPGPAADARRFTAWLRRRGVPAGQVSLLLAPLPGAGGPATDVPEGPAGREAVQEALTRLLPAREGDLLWVFWGGHGVTDPQGHRRLFYTDATGDDRRNLDLDAWLTAFTTDLLPGFPRQVWLVDSCQTFVEDLGFARALPAELPPGGERLPGREQSVLLAAGPGQRAANDPVRQTGAFSDAVLSALDAADGGTWPPDPGALAEAVAARFTGGAGAAAGQRPTSLWYRSGAGDERLLTLPAQRSAERRVPDEALPELIGLLSGSPGMADQQQRQLVVSMLPVELAGSIPRFGATRPDVVSIVRSCRRHPGGLAALVEAVSLIEAGSPEERAVAEWARRWIWPDSRG